MINRISMIVVTWNNDELLRNCLNSVHSVYGRLPETIVVDNANLASTAELCQGFPDVRYIALPKNIGFAGGNNAAIPWCTKEFVFLLNNDTIFHTDSLSPLVEFLDQHPRVGIVQGTMNIPRATNTLDVCGENLTPLGILHHRLLGRPTDSTKLRPTRVSAAKGAMLLFKRTVLDGLPFGLFDPSFKNYFEDIDFCLRAQKKGWETWFVPTPPIDHLCGQTSSKFPSDEIWTQYIRNIFVSLHRYLGLWGHLFTLPVFCCAAFVKSPKAFVNAMRRL